VPPTTRERLLTATNELFRRGGYHATSLQAITAAAHAPVGSLYHHFPGGKSALAEAAITESGASYRALFELLTADATSPGEAFAGFFDGAADVLEETDYIDICPIGTVAREIASTDDVLRAASERVFASWIAAAAAPLRLAGVADAEASSLAATVVAALEGSFMLARASRDAEVVRAAGRHVRRLVDAVVAGQAGKVARSRSTTAASPTGRSR
jgi:AcrR family transcriptional regulator